MIRDVAIVGGGPAGCRLAMLLARDLDVILIEEHDSIGEPVQCGGLVSPRAICDITADSIIREIRDFTLYSPSGKRMDLHAEETKGVVIDRKAHDRSLADIAEKNGAEISLGTRVSGLESERDHVNLACRSGNREEKIGARIIIGADGPKSIVRQHVTSAPFSMMYRGAQIVGTMKDENNNTVEMWVGNKIAPDFFAWKIPAAGAFVRIGLCTSQDEQPMPLLNRFIGTKFPDIQVTDRQAGLIPISNNSILASGRFSLLGDAAGQTKPLTGGGVYLGRRGAELLADSITENGAEPASLELYEQRFKEEFEREISRALLLRKIINGMNDSKLDRAIEILSDEKIKRILEKSIDIDYPSELSNLILRKAPKILQFAPDLLRSLISPGIR